jgi:hypothetical protein
MADKDIKQRKRRAKAEVEHFAGIIEAEPIGVQIGLITGTLPHTGFQIFRSGERKTLSISPFRLGEQPNVRLGIAMITGAKEAISLHEKVVEEMWQSAVKGQEAARYLRSLINAVD